MTRAEMCRIAGGGLVILSGVALVLGGAQLVRHGPAAWPDIVADAIVVRRTAMVMLVLGLILAATGGAAAANLPRGPAMAAIAASAFVVLAFWGNRLLFGDWRPLHTSTNVAVLAVILVLLRLGQ